MNKNEMLSATSLCCSFDNVELTTVDGINILGLSNINESAKDHYIVYRILNHVNGKHYVGQHHTCKPLDDYMGSGDLIKAAVEKYPISCFSKEILHDFNSFEEMNKKEKELVPLSACYPYDKLSYNLREGGTSKMTKETKDKIAAKKLGGIPWNKNKSRIYSEKQLKAIKEKCRLASIGKNNPMYGHSATEFMSKDKIEQWKENISKAIKGKNNPMYGKSIFEYMTKDEIDQWKQQMKTIWQRNKHPCLGRKMMYDLDGKRHYVKNEDITQKLALGWKMSNIELYRQHKSTKHLSGIV